MTSAAGRLLLVADLGIVELSVDPLTGVSNFAVERFGVAVWRLPTKLVSEITRSSSSITLVSLAAIFSSF